MTADKNDQKMRRKPPGERGTALIATPVRQFRFTDQEDFVLSRILEENPLFATVSIGAETGRLITREER